MKSRLRKSALRLLHRAGAIDLWRRIHRKDIAILMLHGTADPRRKSEWTPLRQQFSPARLEWCLTILKERYRFLSFDDAVGILKGDRPPVDYGFVITCDDGYRSNIEDALPVLRKHGAPLTVFVTVSNVANGTPFWFDRLDYALQCGVVDGHLFHVGRRPFRFSGGGRDALAASFARFRRLVKEEYQDEEGFVAKIDEVIAHFERSGGKSLVDLPGVDPWSGLLTWDEIRKAGEYGVCFGSHSLHHLRLAHLDESSVRHQLLESKRAIEDRTVRRCSYFAYPSGNHSARSAAIARECGYAAAVTTVEGLNRIGCDLMALNRVHVPLTNDPSELLAHVSGLSAGLSRINKAFGG